MGNHGQSAWLRDIREYWSRVTLKMAEESGGTPATRETSEFKTLGAFSPVPSGQPRVEDRSQMVTPQAE
jgi:hypothetical protein